MESVESGQITLVVGKLCLCFKNEFEAKGRVFVRCWFAGQGASIFAPDHGDTSADPAAIDGTPSESLITESQPVEIVAKEESGADSAPAAPEGSGDDKTGRHGEMSTLSEGIDTATKLAVVDGDFRVESTRFELTRNRLSELYSTEIRIQILRRVVEEGSDVVLGCATARVADVLRGENQWTCDVVMGASWPPKDVATQDGPSPLDLKAQAESRGADVVTESPLDYGGGCSTIQVTLFTDDITADYTLGAGSLWADGAEITGVPEGWQLRPPPETKASAWNETIAEMLAGQPTHEYSIWWGEDMDDSDKQTCGLNNVPLPAMRLTGGVLSYVPDDCSETRSSAHAGSEENAGSVGTPEATSRGGSTGESVKAAQLPMPPDGTWTVRFPSFRRSGVFLNRTAINELRRSLLCVGGDRADAGAAGREDSLLPAQRNSSEILPVVVERRRLQSATPVVAEQTGKGGKKGKKTGAKAAAAQQLEPPLEKPWRCRAFLNLAPLVIPSAQEGSGVSVSGQDADNSPAFEKVAQTGDSPLLAVLSAPMALDNTAREPSQEDLVENGDEQTSAAADDADPQANGADPAIGEPSQAERRAAQMRSSDMTLHVKIALTRPLVKAPTRQSTSASVGDLFIPKEVGPWKPPRDVEAELKEELDAFVLTVLNEYAKLFLKTGTDGAADVDENAVDDRENRLFYALNSSGIYHSFLERLKPRVQRIVRKRFGAVPADATEADAFMAELYAYLVEQAASVLNQRMKAAEERAIASYVTTGNKETLAQKVDHLGILADDAEARGAMGDAAARHEDRIEAAAAAAEARAEWCLLLAQAWESYAYFSLRREQHLRTRAGSAQLDKATRCLEEAIRVYPPASDESLAATTVLAALSIELRQLDKAMALLAHCQEERLPALEEGADGYETDDLVRLVPRRDHALACLLRDQLSDASGARRNLRLAVLSSKREVAAGVYGALEADDEPGIPRRSAVRVMHDACAWLLELGLPCTARQAFKVAEQSERLAAKKAQERGLSTRTPTSLREASRRFDGLLLLAEASAGATTSRLSNIGEYVDRETDARNDEVTSKFVKAEMLAQEATELRPEDPGPWQALAEARDAQGSVKASQAADAWAAVLDRLEDAWSSGKRGVPPLRLYMRLGALYNVLGRPAEAKTCFLRGCRAWRAPGPWLGCGVACLRLEQWEEAEDALQHASRLDCNSPLVWGNLALLLLTQGEDRLEEADQILAQALRLGLSDALLLREIGSCYVAIGRLEDAENALRLSLAADIDSADESGTSYETPVRGEGKMGNPHTRRRLADVLSARNCTSEAAEEYRRVLESPVADDTERQEVLARCGNLLRRIGRGHEVEQLREALAPPLAKGQLVAA